MKVSTRARKVQLLCVAVDHVKRPRSPVIALGVRSQLASHDVKNSVNDRTAEQTEECQSTAIRMQTNEDVNDDR